MVKKALVLWGPKLDPSPQAAEWMKQSKDKIEPILARWNTLNPEQLMQEVFNFEEMPKKWSYKSCLHSEMFLRSMLLQLRYYTLYHTPPYRDWMTHHNSQQQQQNDSFFSLTVSKKLPMQTTKIPPQDQETIAFYKVLKMVAMKKNDDKKNAVAAGKYKS